MDLLQLEHFLAVVEEGTFTRAAERVSRTQPAVSQSIKKLEEEIGGQLFSRDLHDVSLTEAGKTLVEFSLQVMDREVHVGFVKDEPGFHELKCIEVHADEMIVVAPPHHPLAG